MSNLNKLARHSRQGRELKALESSFDQLMADEPRLRSMLFDGAVLGAFFSLAMYVVVVAVGLLVTSVLSPLGRLIGILLTNPLHVIGGALLLGGVLGAYWGLRRFRSKPSKQQLAADFERQLMAYKPCSQKAHHNFIEEIAKQGGVTQTMFQEWSELEIKALREYRPNLRVALPSVNG